MEMKNKRTVEVFSAGCPVCEETVQLVKGLACPSCEVIVREMHDTDNAARAKALGIHRMGCGY